jgi:hypothetical protein
MTVRVLHLSTDSRTAKYTNFTSTKWTITDGHLTVGDSPDNPEASFAPGRWFDISNNEYDSAGDDEE